MEKREDAASEDIKKLAISLRDGFETLFPLSEECCIYRIPQRIQQLNERACTPQVVSIGPYHHGREELKDMEEQKMRYFKIFLQRTKVSMEDLLMFIKEREARLRNCYAETINLGSNDFVKMILVDAVFLIELLLRSVNAKNTIISCDRVFGKPWRIVDITRDLWSVENQLPMFILDELFEVAKTGMHGDYKGISMVKLLSEFWKCACKILLTDTNFLEKKIYEAKHFVDLLCLCLKPPSNAVCAAKLKTLATPSVTELHQAGVKFKLGSSKHLFDIKFKDGILEIPSLIVADETEGLLRNIQIFEQLHCHTNYVNDYIIVMNYLVNTSKDVELLVQKGVIDNWVRNSEAVSSIFHNLIREARMNPREFNYFGLVEDLNAYCNSPWHKWKANLKQNYFNSPWTSISVIAAVTLLFFTFIQTVCSIIQTIYSIKK